MHNHPSGDPTPSEADIKVTRDLIRAGQLLKIDVLDHVILGRRTDKRERDYVSLRELGFVFVILPMIHPTSVGHPKAQIDPTSSIGPFAVIDEHVVIGSNCRIRPHVHLTGHTHVGSGNIFHAGCVIGDAPQDLKYKDEPTRLVIGERG